MSHTTDTIIDLENAKDQARESLEDLLRGRPKYQVDILILYLRAFDMMRGVKRS